MSAAVALDLRPEPIMDRDRFEREVLSLRPKLFRLAFKLTHNTQEAEDVMLRSIAKAWHGLHTFKEGASFKNWMFRIVTNTNNDRLREKARRIQAVSYDSPLSIDGQDDTVQFETADDGPSPLDCLLSQALSDRMKSALARLSMEHRSVIIRRYVHRLSYEEIADEDKCPVGTIRSRLHRALTAFKAAYEEASPEEVINEPVETVRTPFLPDVPQKFSNVKPVQPLR